MEVRICLRLENMCAGADLSAKSWWQWLQCKVVSRWFGQQAAQHQQQQPHPQSSHEQDNTSINMQQDTSEVGGAPTYKYFCSDMSN